MICEVIYLRWQGDDCLNLTFSADDPDLQTEMCAQTCLRQIEQASGVLLDWDGCIAEADRPTAWATQFIREHQNKIAIVSNNSTHLPEDFARILGSGGVNIAPERIVLAGIEALKRAVALQPKRALVLGDGRIKAYAHNLGLPLVQDDADLIVLLRDLRFTYQRLERAANCLKGGARLIVANPDSTHPGRRGMVVPETGALYAALMACVGSTGVQTEIIGKPAPLLFHRACISLGIDPRSAIMLGDNPATDIAGANALRMPSVLVGARGAIGFQDLVRNITEVRARPVRKRRIVNSPT